ncbi:hypothetical protein F2P56_015732 [Juglans regia]|uniref:Reverse transcriptase Ty1/copia-type domain-containing protein n=1 Tax=Juglans regia TaxID=51240 RepID=A0A833XG96_JUGRE|nr:hypothetical protein F2P56_015732 [Juglans regia]
MVSSFASVVPPFVIPNITPLVFVKLVGTNYLNWTTQYVPILRSHDLLSIVDGSKACPSNYVLDSTDSGANNHITADLENLTLQQQPYHGNDKVIVDNGGDDTIVTNNTSSSIDALISNLSCESAVKDLGPLSYFLGIQVTNTANGLHLHQGKYAVDLLHRMKMVGAKPASTPCTTGGKLSKLSGDPPDDPTEYRTMVGALQYLTLTRPDLSYSVNHLCRFLHCPRTTHLTVAKRVLRYLKCTLQFGLQFSKGSL